MRLPAPLVCAALLLAGVAPLCGATPPADVRLEGPAPAVFEQLGKLYGVRVRVADDLPARPLRLELRQVDFPTALRVAAQLAGAFWAEQQDGSVLVAADTPENRQRYQPQVEKTFSLPGRTPEELTDVVRLLREVLDMRRIRPDPRSSTFTVRDTPFRLAVAEQLLAQLQEPPGEVWVDVLLLEVDREQAQRLGILPPDQAVAAHLGAGALVAQRTDVESLLKTLQLLLQLGVLPEAVVSRITIAPASLKVLLPPFILFGGGGTTYAALLPGAELNLLRLARVTRSLRRFSLRAREGEEASLFAGDRFPVVFTTFSSSFISPIEQELRKRGIFIPPVPAVRYEELGLRVTVTPRLHPGREVSLSLKLDQKALTGQTFNGIPVLSNRALEQRVRLREGESLLLAGLQGRTREVTGAGTPGLGSLPVIGRLFRRTAPSTQETELLVLVTPRIVRLPAPEPVRALYVGTEREFAPVGAAPASEAVAPAPPPSPQPPPQN